MGIRKDKYNKAISGNVTFVRDIAQSLLLPFYFSALIYLLIIMSKTIDHEIETLIREFIHISSQFLVSFLSLDNKKVSWRHRNVVFNFFRLFLF